MVSQSQSKEIWMINLCMRGLMLSKGEATESCHQCNGVGSVTHQDAPSATFGDHQPSREKSTHVCKTFFLILILLFRQFWQSFKSFIMTFEDEIFMSPATCGWRASWFLNIQICARCLRRPNMKYLCLRVTQSRPRMKYSGLCHVSRTIFPPQNLPKLLSSQILRPGFKSR